MKARCDL